VIVVIGSPLARVTAEETVAAGLAAAVARIAAAAGAQVELIGRVGDDPSGDAAVLDLAATGVGHVALLRTAGAATPVETEPRAAGAVEPEPDSALTTAVDADDATELKPRTLADGLAIDAGDLELGLRYVPDYRVIVVAALLDQAGWRTVIDAVGWSGAALIATVPADGTVPELPADGTVFERPDDGADGAFAGVVGRYAAALDAGREPAAAFASATAGDNWSTVED
jgi:hypothetical protein